MKRRKLTSQVKVIRRIALTYLFIFFYFTILLLIRLHFICSRTFDRFVDSNMVSLFSLWLSIYLTAIRSSVCLLFTSFQAFAFIWIFCFFLPSYHNLLALRSAYLVCGKLFVRAFHIYKYIYK